MQGFWLRTRLLRLGKRMGYAVQIKSDSDKNLGCEFVFGCVPIPNKYTSLSVRRYNMYLTEGPYLSEPQDIAVNNGIISYNADELEMLVLNDLLMENGLALVGIDENAAKATIIYLYGGKDTVLDDEVLLGNYLYPQVRERAMDLLRGARMPGSGMHLALIDGYDNYDGTKTTKVLFIRKNFVL